MAYNMYMAAKKLNNYFEEHPITVMSTTPLYEIISCKDATSRVAKWAIELAAHTIQYKPRTMIKSQILADFSSIGQRTSTCLRPQIPRIGG
jgi:hypothetical protein